MLSAKHDVGAGRVGVERSLCCLRARIVVSGISVAFLFVVNEQLLMQELERVDVKL